MAKHTLIIIDPSGSRDVAQYHTDELKEIFTVDQRADLSLGLGVLMGGLAYFDLEEFFTQRVSDEVLAGRFTPETLTGMIPA